MQPLDHLGQVVREFRISTSPATTFSVEFDAFGNRHHFFDIHHPHRRLDITVDAIIERNAELSNAALVEKPVSWTDLNGLEDDWDMWEYLNETAQTSVTPSLTAWLKSFPVEEDENPLARLERFTRYMYESFSYVPGSTHVDSTVDELLAKKSGVCQDYAHLMLSCVRSWGIPSRYVSGYLYDSQDRSGTADNATHAWVECWLPEMGWMPFDPTNVKVDKANLITVALGRDYRDVAPSQGITYGGGRSELIVGVTVKKQPVEETEARMSFRQRSMQQ